MTNLGNTIVKAENYRILSTGRDYDFIAAFVNTSNEYAVVKFTGDSEFLAEPFIVSPNDWVGIDASDNGFETVSAFTSGDFTVELFDTLDEAGEACYE